MNKPFVIPDPLRLNALSETFSICTRRANERETYRLVPAVTRCGVFRCVQGEKRRPQLSPGRLSRNRRVAEAQGAPHPALLPLLQQFQLTQAGQAGLQPLLVSASLLFHGQRERRQQKLGAARRLARRHHPVFQPAHQARRSRWSRASGQTSLRVQLLTSLREPFSSSRLQTAARSHLDNCWRSCEQARARARTQLSLRCLLELRPVLPTGVRNSTSATVQASQRVDTAASTAE